MTELQRLLAMCELGERYEQVADNARDRARCRVKVLDELPAGGLEQSPNGLLLVESRSSPLD